jgi:hypothetical protein
MIGRAIRVEPMYPINVTAHKMISNPEPGNPTSIKLSIQVMAATKM